MDVADLRGFVGRLGVTAQNALEVARFGGFVTDDEATPYEVTDRVGIAKVRRYHLQSAAAPDDGSRPVVLLVPPLMMTAEVWDVSPTTSAVRHLLGAGIDARVVDFGSPEHERGGLERTLTEHVVAVADAVGAVHEATGREVHLAGYSQGGMFAYQAAALRRSVGLASLVTFGSPVDVHAGVPWGLPQAELTEFVARLAGALFGRTSVPGWMTRAGFKLLDPVKTVQSRVEFLLALHDRDRLLAREPQRRFLDGEGFIAWPGPALAEFAEQFVAHNRMLAGGFVIGDRLVTLADITCPVLVVVGEADDIAPPGTIRAIDRAAPSAAVSELAIPTGHFGLVVGSRASAVTWPAVAAWIRAREQEDVAIPENQPDDVGAEGAAAAERTGEHRRSSEPDPDDVGAEGAAAAERTGEHRRSSEPELWGAVDHEATGSAAFGPTPTQGAQLVIDAGLDLGQAGWRLARRGASTLSSVTGGALELLPRLLRLERVDADTRVSLALLLDERARETPDGVFFLHGDRAHTWAAAKGRVDAVVRGLVELGVRHGEHVGVLMGTRPSALALVAALNRLGAVAVLLRPDGELTRELELGQVRRLVVDPEHVAVVAEAGVPVAVLGGGGSDRELGGLVVDLERIDPELVELPGWYRANPGRAGDLAFVLFTGRGERTRVNRILNGRWALSAFGTASAARLGEGDTVFGATPVFHPSGLLTAIGGAVASGSRLALVGHDADEDFWTRSRRTGATVVSYTWTSLREVVDGPVTAAERGSPIRLFVGSGLPVGLWSRVLERVPGAAVCEFYATTEGGVVLANVAGGKLGSKGRPLPGSARIALAAWDLERDRLVVGDDGFAVASDVGEPGMLLARTEPGASSGRVSPLRGVFRRGDAWIPTGEVMWRDGDGDHWLLGSTASLVHTARGVVAPVPIEDRLGLLDAVDLAVAYGVPTDEPGVSSAVAAVTVRAGAELDAEAVTRLFAGVADDRRPDAVRVVDDIPVTAWHRPITTTLRAEGLPRHRRAAPVLRWSPDDAAYRPR